MSFLCTLGASFRLLPIMGRKLENPWKVLQYFCTFVLKIRIEFARNLNWILNIGDFHHIVDDWKFP